MPQPLVISIPHTLGKAEAVRRLKSGLANAEAKFSQFLSVQEQTWTGDRLAFRIVALAQAASGTIDVAEDHVRLEVELPWLLAKVAERIQRVVKTEGAILLDKK